MSLGDSTDDPQAWGLPPSLPRERAIHAGAALVRAVRARRLAEQEAEEADRDVARLQAQLDEAKSKARRARGERERRRTTELAARATTTAAMARAKVDRLEVQGARIVHAASASRVAGDAIEVLARDSLRVYIDPPPPAQLTLAPLRAPVSVPSNP